MNHGAWVQDNLKVSIANLAASNTTADPYGTFDVLVRSAQDSDKKPQIVERYSGVSLNPDSANYIARQIGDVFTSWDSNTKVNRQYGNYANRSEFLRVEVNPDVDNALTEPELLPFGVFGPIRPKGFAIMSGSTEILNFGSRHGVATGYEDAFVDVSGIGQEYHVPLSTGAIVAGVFFSQGTNPFTGSYRFPATRTRLSASEGGYDSKTGYEKAYFGLSTDIGFETGVKTTPTNYSTRFDPGYGDYLRGLPFVAGASEDSRFDGITGPPSEHLSHRAKRWL